MPDWITDMLRLPMHKRSPWPSKGCRYAVYYSPTRRKYTYQEIVNGIDGIKAIVNKNFACYASFKNMFNNYTTRYKKKPNYMVSKWWFTGRFVTDHDVPGPGIWERASLDNRTHYAGDPMKILEYRHFRNYINESKRLGFMESIHTPYWLNRQEVTTHLLKHNVNMLYFLWSHERYMIEYPGVIGYLNYLMDTYSDMDPYIRMAIALYAGGASTSHGYFNQMGCYTTDSDGGWSFKRVPYAAGIVNEAYKLRECCRKGVGGARPLKKAQAKAFYCSNNVLTTRISQYDTYRPRKVEDLKTFKLEDYKDE